MIKRTLFTLLFMSSASIGYAAFDPWLYNVYQTGSIGSVNNPYGSDFQGIAGAANNAYFQNFSLNALGVSTGYSLYTGGNVGVNSGSINNGGINAGGNLHLNSTSVFGQVDAGGNLSGNGGQIHGNVKLGGVNTSSITVSGSVSTGQPFTPAVDFAKTNQYFQGASSYWGGLAPTANWTTQYGLITVDALHAGTNVVNLTTADINSAYGIALTGANSAYVIFNITDAGAATLHSPVFNLSGGMTLSDILFNLPNNTQLTLNGGTFSNIMAVGSTITFPNGLVTGNLISNNLYGAGQVNLGYFVGFQHDQSHWVTTPEPGTYFLLGSLLFLGYLRKRSSVRKVQI